MSTVAANACTKFEAKLVAIRVIQKLSSMKYFYAKWLIAAICDETKDVKIQKEAYAQARRALHKLGYTHEDTKEMYRPTSLHRPRI